MFVFYDCRLLDVVHSDKNLYLVFEYLNQDLKKYMDTVGDGGISPKLVKVTEQPYALHSIIHNSLEFSVLIEIRLQQSDYVFARVTRASCYAVLPIVTVTACCIVTSSHRIYS